MADPMLSRERAWALVQEHVQSESLRKHLLGVEAAVRGYARAAGEDEEAWGFVALVHDFDYEKFPTARIIPTGCRDPAGIGVPRVGHAGDPVARRLQRGHPRVRPGEDVVRV